jgi:hypothetical protein
MPAPTSLVWYAACLFAAAWPLLAGPGALPFDDLAPYVRGGHLAVERAVDLVTPHQAPAPGAASTGTGGPVALVPADVEVSGVRSIAYSVAAYLGGAWSPRFTLLALVQAAVLAGLAILWSRLEGGGPRRAALALAVAPAAAYHASQGGPDVWAGLVILAFVLLAAYGARLGRLGIGFTALVIAFGVAAHASHVLLALGLLLVTIGWTLIMRRPLRQVALTAALPAAAVGLGIGATALTGLIGFGEASIAPKRYPIVLARAIEDGPALWHLEAECETYDYTVCRLFPDGIPGNVGDFLWNEGGVVDRATPAQMEAIRAEEPLILQRAAADYPLFGIRQMVGNVAEQLVRFGLNGARLGSYASYTGGGEIAVGDRDGPRWPTVLLDRVHVLFILAAVAAFGIALWRGWRPGAAALFGLVLIVLGLAGNALICGGLSVPVDRYQSRVIWLVPLAAVILLAPFARRYRALLRK